MTDITGEKIREHIYALKDDKYKEFHGSLVPGENTIIGVRVPVLRQYARELYKEFCVEGNRSADELITLIDDDHYEEIMLKGMIIGMQKQPDLYKLFTQIDGYVPKIKNWATCDIFCGGLKVLKKYPEETYEYLQKYLRSDEEYFIRFGVVMLLQYYINEEYIDRIFEHTEQIYHDGYYVKMAVAWLISICFVKFYDETKEFMEHAALDDFTYNKALQKARESYRITPEQKRELNEMKRKVRKNV